MAKIEIVNLDNIVANRVHSPRVDGFPIYGRVDGAMENGEGRITTKSERWLNKVSKCYTSPDNIRRVFITHRAIYVSLYRPIRNVSSSLQLERPLKQDLLEVCTGLVPPGPGLAPTFRVDGSGISAIARPWVCSNIEELYFDWSVFLSHDIMNMGFGDVYHDVILAQGGKGPVNLNIIKQIFQRFCMGGVKDLKSRFPRLRCVGYIQNLDEVYKAVPMKRGADSIEDFLNPWCLNSIVKSAIKSNQATIWEIEPANKWILERSVKSNVYTFDREVLDGYFNNLESRIKAFRRSELDKKADEQREQKIAEAQKIKGSFEKLADSIYEAGGIEAVKSSIMISLKHSTSAERHEIYESLTSDGKVRYGGILIGRDKGK